MQCSLKFASFNLSSSWLFLLICHPLTRSRSYCKDICVTFICCNILGLSIQQVPAYACIGDSVDIVCSVSVPDPANNTFLTPEITFIIDDSENFASVLTVNVGTDFEGFDLTRLTATPDVQSFTVISGNLTISPYMMGDGSLIFGCGQTYFLSDNTPPTASVNVTLELQSVGMLCHYSNSLFKQSIC